MAASSRCLGSSCLSNPFPDADFRWLQYATANCKVWLWPFVTLPSSSAHLLWWGHPLPMEPMATANWTEWMGLMPRLWQSHQHCGFDGGDTAKRNHSWLMLTGHLKCPSVMPGPRQKRDKWWPQSWNSERDRRRVLTQWYVMYLAHHVPWTSISNDEMCHCALQRERETDRERQTERERYRLVFVLLCLCQACYGIFMVLLYQLQGSDCDGMCVCVFARAHYVYIKHRYARSSLHIMLQQAPSECDASWTLIVPWPVSMQHATLRLDMSLDRQGGWKSRCIICA